MQMNLYNVKGESLKQKAGVSLIAVLLFMLIATIAATATWKWITSEGFSSTSRMLKREAYQSSIAGIENARAWMTYHANDVGALIKQYLDGESGTRVAINLDGRLRQLQRAGQNYNVWLTGVNVEGSTYKLKIYSAGEARNGAAKHNEVAIFNVDGLYRISIPQETVHRAVPFDYNYFGGTTTNHGDVFARSMLVNGDLLDGNPASIESNLVVTGNFKVSGNSIGVQGTACIGGYLDADNGIVGNNFYVNGDLKNLKIRQLTAQRGGGGETVDLGDKIYGNLYVNGNITAANGDQVIDGNLTLNGKWTTNMSGYRAGVKGNLCVGDTGQIYFPNLDREFKGGGNVWMSSDRYSIWTGFDNYDKYNRITLGSAGSDVYVKMGHAWSDYKTLREQTYVFNETAEPFSCADNTCNAHDRKWDGGPAGKNRKIFDDRKDKAGLHYLYNWTATTPLVSLETFHDDHWNKDLLVYMVNGERFWDTYNEVHSLNVSGSQITGTPYCRQVGSSWGFFGPAFNSLRDKSRPACGVSPWFKVEGNFRSSFPSSKPSDLTCAESVKTHCDSIWEKPADGGCGTAEYLVPDALKTGITYFESFATKSTCATTLLNGSTSTDGFDFGTLSGCYTTAKQHDDAVGVTTEQKILYNDYLVVKVATGKNIFHSPTGQLTGKFIFIIENDLNTNLKIPPTNGESSFAFMYFKDGLNGEIGPANNDGDYNYFIYTKNNIQNVLFNTTVLKGSVYASVVDETSGAKTCAKVNNLTFNRGMEYNESLMESLTESRILCANDGSACGGVGEAPTTDPTTEEDVEEEDIGVDRYFISMAPQLGISIASRYEAEERPPVSTGSSNVKPSYIILPRVIYLPSDPYGELPDYYNVVPLNGSSLQKSDVVNLVSCSGDAGSLPHTGKLFEGAALPQGIYKCIANPSGDYDQIPFWVVVGKSQRGDGTVRFKDPSQKLGASDVKTVDVILDPHSSKITLSVVCPAFPNSAWSYTKSSYFKEELSSGTKCVFEFPTNVEGVVTLFNVTTDNATEGTLTFTLQPGEGFTLGSPYYTDLHVSSMAKINRSTVGIDLVEWCNVAANAGKCPCAEIGKCTAADNLNAWPNCSYDGIWVQPEAAGMVVITDLANESWSVPVGGSGTIKFADLSNGKCVVVIPEGTSNEIDRSEMQAEHEYPLKAIAKAKNRKMKIAFVGDVDNHVPVVSYNVGGRTGSCTFAGLGLESACPVSVFDGEEISFEIDMDNPQNEKFKYWQCSGSTCVSDVIKADSYDGFVLNDDETVMYVHFGEVDEHCFIDEFKDDDLQCTGTRNEYCVDDCGTDGVCEGVVDPEAVYDKAKWHLLSGSLDFIDAYAGHISIKTKRKLTRGVNNRNNAIRIISTTSAGINGTLKALFRMPQATSSYGKLSENIANSGFMLRSNSTGTDYLMLNLFVNTNKKLEAQLCTQAGSCLNGELKDGSGSSKTVSTASMVMMSATLNDNSLVVSGFTGTDYYGSPDEYTYTFNLSGLATTYADRAHEYVGFNLADPNFKLYGIGWESLDYSASCWDTPPSVKCSFAAKAQDGIVRLDQFVKPWVGHSGWHNTESCTPHYYYYNGTDACNGSVSGSVECTSEGYKFAASGKGLHGFSDGSKTAKVSLECLYGDDSEQMWRLSTETDAERAHCGMFWTGEFQECSDNIPTLLANRVLVDTLYETLIVSQGSRRNLRGATLHISLDNPDNNEVELVLVSKHDNNEGLGTWGDAGTDSTNWFMSRSVKITGNSASFDVMNDLASGAEGFDPEKVRNIILKNHGISDVTVKLISASCKNAVSVMSCDAAYNDSAGKWHITAKIENITEITTTEQFSVGTKVEGPETKKKCGDAGNDECTKDNGSGTLEMWLVDNPYVNQGKSYQIKVYATKGTKTSERECRVTPDPIGAINRECRVSQQTVQQGHGMPQFQLSVYGCPSSGCPYEIRFDGSTISAANSSTTSGTTVKVTPGMNTEESPLSLGEHTFRAVAPTGSPAPFDDCVATFNVIEESTISSEVATECFVDGSNERPGITKSFKFYVNNGVYNISGRNYKVVLPDGSERTGSTGTVYEQNVQFTVPVHPGKIELYVWNNGAYEKSCETEVTVQPITPSNCRFDDNDRKFKADFASVCDNHVCTWELKETIGETTTSVAQGYVDRNTIEAQIAHAATGIYTLWVNDEETACVATKQTINNTLGGCPTDEQSAPTATFTPTGLSCNSESCAWSITGGASISMSGSTVTIGNAVAGNTYLVSVNDGGTSKKCSVRFREESSCWFERNGNVSEIPTGYKWTNFKIKPTSAITSNTTGTLLFNSQSYNVDLYSGGNTSQYSNLPMPTTAGTYNYSVTTNSGNAVCSGSIVVRDPISCSVESNVVSSGGQASFTGTIDQSLKTRFDLNPSCKIKIGDATNRENLTTTTSITPTITGTTVFTFECNVQNVDQQTRTCSETVVTSVSAPDVDCPSTDYSVEPGANVTFNPASLTNCDVECSYTVSYAGSSVKTGSIRAASDDVVFATERHALGNTTTDPYTFTVTNSAGSYSCTFGVGFLKPTYSCPANMESGVNSTVTVTPTNVQNCTQGCSYSVTKGSASGTEVLASSTGTPYTSGALGSGFTGESTTGEKTYYMTLSNPAGSGTTCSFKVTYKNAADMCKCSDYCSDCTTITTGSGTYNSATYRCIFFTDLDFMNLSVGNGATINGVTVTKSSNQCDDVGNSAGACADFLNDMNVSPVNGGYYLSLPSNTYAQITVSGSAPSACASH